MRFNSNRRQQGEGVLVAVHICVARGQSAWNASYLIKPEDQPRRVITVIIYYGDGGMS